MRLQLDGAILNDATKANKRLSVVSNTDPDLSYLDLSLLDGAAPDQSEGRYLRVAIVKDDHVSHAEGATNVAEVNTDGVGRIRRAVRDLFVDQGGYDNAAGHFKPVIYHRGEDRKGAIMGKMAFHTAHKKMSDEMDRLGVDIILHESAVKQVGDRPLQKMVYDPDTGHLSSRRRRSNNTPYRAP